MAGSAIFVLGFSLPIRRAAGWFIAWLVGITEGEDVTDGGAVPAVQLPPSVFQNYGEVEEDDPYRYYQPNYPAPRPVAPDDPALALGDIELRSPGVYRTSRSVKEEEEKVGSKRRLKRGAAWTNWEELILIGRLGAAMD